MEEKHVDPIPSSSPYGGKEKIFQTLKNDGVMLIKYHDENISKCSLCCRSSTHLVSAMHAMGGQGVPWKGQGAFDFLKEGRVHLVPSKKGMVLHASKKAEVRFFLGICTENYSRIFQA
jgi:hypothetical protein